MQQPDCSVIRDAFRFNASLINYWRRQWHPTPVLLPGKSHGRRSLVGYSPWVTKSRTRLSVHFHFSLSCIGEGNGNPLNVLAWRIPGTREPGGLPSMGSHMTEATQQQQQHSPSVLGSTSIWFYLKFVFPSSSLSSFILLPQIPSAKC